MPRSFYKLRWLAGYPLQRRIFRGRITVGELLWACVVIAVAVVLTARAYPGKKLTGQVTSIAGALTLALATRNSVWSFLLGLPFDRALAWHGLFAYITASIGLLHGLKSWLGGRVRLPVTDEMFVSGWTTLGSMILLVSIAAFPQLRRWSFDLFYRSHVFLFLVAVGGAVIHGSTYMAIGGAAWGLDVLIRMLYMAGLKNPHEAEVVALPGGVVRVAWPKGEAFRYAGGQYVFLCIPALSIWAWHPFSISSHPGHDTVHLHIRVLGDWTRRLHSLAGKQVFSDGSPARVKVLVEGPYGSPRLDLHGSTYSMFLLISGGIGVTPMQSIFNDLLSQRARGRPISKLWFVWSVREKHMLSSVLHNTKFARKHLPAQLPTSFSPDLISPHARQAAWATQPAPPLPSPNTRGTGFELQRDPEAAHGRSLAAGSGPSGVDDREAEGCVNTDFYLTSPPGQQELHGTPLIDAAAGLCPETQACLRHGRPDLPAILARMRQLVLDSGGGRAAVMVCGPASMVRQVEALAAHHSGGGAWLDCHAESFHL
ncbi:MAG: hypothetical protein WDW36_000401 [Sanguina aurantia]